jgi:hypothetical protein
MSRATDDATESLNVRLVSRTDLGGHGDLMHVNVRDGVAYIGHMGADRVGTSVVDVSDPRAPKVITQLTTPEGTHSHKVQLVGDTLLVNYERNPLEKQAADWRAGLMIYDVSDPAHPKETAFFPTSGKGVHRMTYWHDPYAYVSTTETGWSEAILIILDVSDPTNPVEVSRWWIPGMHTAAGEMPSWPGHRTWKLHHAIVKGDRAYCAWWDAGIVILDISDRGAPKMISQLEFGEEVSGCTHSALPLLDRGLLITTDEEVTLTREGIAKRIRVVDISDETRPRVVSTFPLPVGPFPSRPGRYGPHNLHEMRPLTFQSDHIIHATYFNAGLRIYDTADPEHVQEIGYFVPRPPDASRPIQLNDLTVTPDGLIYVTDRIGAGLYVLEADIDLT